MKFAGMNDAQVLEEFYKTHDSHKKVELELKIKFEGYADPFSIKLKEYGKVDCLISHFGYNYYFRTPAGMRFDQYTTFKALRAAVVRKARTLGFIPEYFLLVVQPQWSDLSLGSYQENYQEKKILVKRLEREEGKHSVQTLR